MKIRAEDQAAIDAFIAKKGVTKLPPSGSPELAEHHARQNSVGHDWKAQRDQSRLVSKATAAVKARDHKGKFLVKPALLHEIGPRPELAWLPLAKLRVDRTYQRNMDREHVRKLAAGFTWAAFKPLSVIVGNAGGETFYWVVDGQHESEAARLVGLVEVPCMIVTAPDKRKAAEAFVMLNRNRKPVTGVDLYYAALAAREPWALQIERLLADAGVTACREGMTKPMETKAVTTLRRLCGANGGEAVKRMLGIIAAAWPQELKAFRERPILSITRLIAADPNVTDARILQYLKPLNSYQFERAVWSAAEQWATEPAQALKRLVAGERPGRP